jgi:hypothetical protein
MTQRSLRGWPEILSFPQAHAHAISTFELLHRQGPRGTGLLGGDFMLSSAIAASDRTRDIRFGRDLDHSSNSCGSNPAPVRERSVVTSEDCCQRLPESR